MKYTITAVLVATAVFGACSNSPTESGRTQPVGFTTVTKGNYSGFNSPNREVIRDQQLWSEAWAQLVQGRTPVPPVPTIDFASDMLVLAAMGTRPNGCYSTDIRAIESSPDGRITVEVAEIDSSASCACTLAIVHPVHVVRLARRDGQVEFRTVQVAGSC